MDSEVLTSEPGGDASGIVVTAGVDERRICASAQVERGRQVARPPQSLAEAVQRVRRLRSLQR